MITTTTDSKTVTLPPWVGRPQDAFGFLAGEPDIYTDEEDDPEEDD